MPTHPSREYMLAAIAAAKVSAARSQYAIGSVVVGPDGRILSVTHTSIHEDNDPTAHSEINAIRAACRKTGGRYLANCWMYTTLEPCPMCAAAAIWAKLGGIVYGSKQEDASWAARNLKEGRYSWRQIEFSAAEILEKGEPKVKLVPEFMRAECSKVLDLNVQR